MLMQILTMADICEDHECMCDRGKDVSSCSPFSSTRFMNPEGSPEIQETYDLLKSRGVEFSPCEEDGRLVEMKLPEGWKLVNPARKPTYSFLFFLDADQTVVTMITEMVLEEENGHCIEFADEHKKAHWPKITFPLPDYYEIHRGIWRLNQKHPTVKNAFQLSNIFERYLKLNRCAFYYMSKSTYAHSADLTDSLLLIKRIEKELMVDERAYLKKYFSELPIDSYLELSAVLGKNVVVRRFLDVDSIDNFPGEIIKHIECCDCCENGLSDHIAELAYHFNSCVNFDVSLPSFLKFKDGFTGWDIDDEEGKSVMDIIEIRDPFS